MLGDFMSPSFFVSYQHALNRFVLNKLALNRLHN